MAGLQILNLNIGVRIPASRPQFFAEAHFDLESTYANSVNKPRAPPPWRKMDRLSRKSAVTIASV